MITVRDGIVDVECNKNRSNILTCNIELRYNAQNRTTKQLNVDWYEAAAWMYGQFTLNGANIEELKLRFMQHFNLKLSVDNKILDKVSFYGLFPEGVDVLDVLKAIKTIYMVNYELREDEVVITAN